MKEKEYLNKLKFFLWFRLPKEELQEILADYTEYFAEGRSQGENEKVIATRLGTPKTAAKELLEERVSPYFSPRGWLLILACAAPLFCLRISFSGFFPMNGYFLDPILMFLATVAAFCLTIPSWKKEWKPNRSCHIFGLCASVWSLLCIAFFVSLLLYVAFHPVERIGEWFFPLRNTLMISSRIVVALAWLWLLIDRRCLCPRQQCASFWYMALLAGMQWVYNILLDLADIKELFTLSLWITHLAPLFCGTALYGIVFLIVKMKAGK